MMGNTHFTSHSSIQTKNGERQVPLVTGTGGDF